MVSSSRISALVAAAVFSSQTMAWTTSEVSTRRQAFQAALTKTATVAAIVAASPTLANADGSGEEDARITTRMGGLLEQFQDGGRGIRMMVPSGWNKFEGEVGAYDIKWQDLVDNTENIKISSTPVKSTTESITILGPVEELGIKLASKRNAKLLSAKERVTEGITFYTFDFAINDGTHQLLTMCVAKSKLWSIDASAKEKRWNKRSELFTNSLGSFIPRLNSPAN